MQTGKLSNKLLEERILNKITRSEAVIEGPAVGKDCAVVDLNDDYLVVSTDPITGADENSGYIGVHISCNDLIATGALPVGVMVTILAPDKAELSDIERVMDDVRKAAKELDISILGGHTEITKAVNAMVLSFTAIGKVGKKDFAAKPKPKAGDYIIMTKTAGIEGSSILASDREDRLLDVLSREELEHAKKLGDNLSILKEGKVGIRNGASLMHDVTEGGVLGAVWEIASAAGFGADIYLDEIPVLEITQKICGYFSISPYKLISSGALLMIVRDADKILDELKGLGVLGTVIGKLTKSSDIFVHSKDKFSKEQKKELMPPETDHLFIALEK